MSLIVKRFEPDINVLKNNLRHWFRFDHLTPEQGIALLIGMNANGTYLDVVMNWGKKLSEDKLALHFGIDLLNGDEIGGCPDSPDEEVPAGQYWTDEEIEEYLDRSHRRFEPFAQRYKQLFQYWKSGKHPECTPLKYFVEWARSKDSDPSWIHVAAELGLISGQASVIEVKPVISTDRAHLSDKLVKMNQAAAKFWGNADRNDRGTHPDNATVSGWLEQQGFSQTLANKAATIIRPEWAPTGRKPEE